MRVHPKVGWAAFASAVYTAVVGVLAAYGYTMPSEVAAGLTGVIAALAGFAAPSPAVASSAPAAAPVAEPAVVAAPVSQDAGDEPAAPTAAA